MKQTLIILRGAPCSGKSTIGEQLRDFDSKIVWLHTDAYKSFFSNPNEDRILDDVMDACIVTLSNLLDKGFSVVYEGIFKKQEYILKAIQLAKGKNISVATYHLACSLGTLQKRDVDRKGVKEGCRKPLGEEIIESLFNKVQENPINEAITLNTEDKTLEECVELIKKNFD